MHPALSAMSLRAKEKPCVFSCVSQAIGAVSLEAPVVLQASACLPRLCVQAILIHRAQVWAEQWSVNTEPVWILVWEQSQVASVKRKPSIPWLGAGGLEKQPLCVSLSSWLWLECSRPPIHPAWHAVLRELASASPSPGSIQQGIHIHTAAGALLTATGYSGHQCPCWCGVPSGFTC